MHEATISMICADFHVANWELVSRVPMLSHCIKVKTAELVPYAAERGFYVPDVSIRSARKHAFLVEVAHTQSYSAVRDKIAKQLQDPFVLGVLLVKIKETLAWSSPDRVANDDDKVAQDDWLATLQQSRDFGAVSNLGMNWMNGIRVEVLLFENGDTSGNYPVAVCSIFFRW